MLFCFRSKKSPEIPPNWSAAIATLYLKVQVHQHAMEKNQGTKKHKKTTMLKSGSTNIPKGCMVQVYLDLHLADLYGFLAGKYTVRPMDPPWDLFPAI